MLNLFSTTERKQTAANPAQNENRTAMVEAIADLKTERADKLKPLNTELQRATDALEDAQQALILAQANKHTAEHKVRETRASYDGQLSRIERKLLASVPASINLLIEQIKAEKREILNETPTAPAVGVTVKAKARSEARNKRIEDTNARLELLRKSTVKAEGLRLSTAEGIDSGLQTIRETLGLPPVGSMQ